MSEALREAYLGPYRVEAFNASKEFENKIHDDDVARRFGFRGGLVPGVDVYAYMTHLPVQRWGLAWIERGTAECRFLKPVYDGDAAVVSAAECPLGWICRSKATESSVSPAAPPCLPSGSRRRLPSAKLRSRRPSARQPTRRRSQSARGSRSTHSG